MALFGRKSSDDEFTPRNASNHISDDQDRKYGDHDRRRSQAASGLRDGETAASKIGDNVSKMMGLNGGSEEARQSEDNVASSSSAASTFRNMVSGRGENEKGKGKFSAKNIMKKMMPALVAGGGVAGFGALSFFGQMAMPFSLIAQFQGNFDSIGTSNTYRSTKFLNWQMDTENRKVKDCIKSKIFSADEFKISKKQRTKLAKSGITVDDSGDFTVMKYTNADGLEITVVPDSRQASGDSVVAFADMYETDQGFRDSYTQGSRTWRGSVGAWFDNLANKFLSYFGVSRGIWSRFKTGNNTDEDLKAMRTTISDEAGTSGRARGSGSSTDIDQTYDEDTQSTDINQNTNSGTLDIGTDDIDADSTGRIDASTADSSRLSNKLNAFGNSVAGKVTGASTAIASGVCSALNVVGAINLVVAAYQTTQIIKVASGIFESIQKGQVEDSSTTPINAVANSLTMSSTRTYQYKDSSGDYHEETRTRSAMEAESVSALYGNTATNYNDASIQGFNLTNSIGVIADALDVGTESFKACAYTQMAAGIVDAVMDGMEVVGCILTFGVGCAIDAALDAVIDIAANISIEAIVSTIVSILLPQIVQVLTRKIATDVMGEDLGNALVSGANIYMGQNHQYSGGSVANKEGLARYAVLRDQVNADNARIARETLSPFDITSPYTFLGSLLTKMIPATVTASSVVQSISSFGNIISSSVSSLMPGASAITAGITAQEAANSTAEHCPYLDSIGAVGDAYCNPYIVTDTRTLDDDPAGVVNTVEALGENFEDTGSESDVPTIKNGSNLAKYILYCGQRQSPFGMADNNIASDVQFSTGSTGDSIIGAIPIVGDLYGSFQQEQTLLNYGYVTGEACVIDNQAGANTNYGDWEENQQYQRFIEDQRLAENEGLIEKSAVTAFLEDYYEENPIDNSYEGVLARRSGLTKDQVVATLDTMEYVAWLAGYSPEDLAPYTPETEPETQYAFDNDDYEEGISATIPTIFYEEKKQRNFAA